MLPKDDGQTDSEQKKKNAADKAQKNDKALYF